MEQKDITDAEVLALLGEAADRLDCAADQQDLWATEFDSIGEPELSPSVARCEAKAKKFRDAEALVRLAISKLS